jgi:PIN domain nuclease of toxin-antitoxin system
LRLLLDTNVFLRWVGGSAVPRSVERVLTRRDTECVVSIVTGWEIIMKPKLGLTPTEVEAAIGEIPAVLLPIKFKHLNELSHLPPYEHHRDPFDRMLIAQALAEDLAIISSDARFAAYKRLQVLWD